jgi:small ligand-binding sensory domain FIST
MLAAGAGISERAESLGAAEDALRQALAPLGGRQADLLLFFATTHHAPHLEAIHDRLTQVAGTERVVGCSGGGVLAGRREVEEGPGAVVLALAADGLQVHAFHDPGFGDDNRESGRRIGAVVGQAARDNPLLVAFPDPYTMRGTEFLAGVADHGGRLPMVGGAAAHDGTHPRTYQLGPAGVTSHGVSGVLLSGPLRHTVGLSQACHPLCPPEVVTAAEGNRIDEIGGRPAMEVLAALLREQGILQFPAAAGLIFLAVPLDPADATLKAGRYTARVRRQLKLAL